MAAAWMVRAMWVGAAKPWKVRALLRCSNRLHGPLAALGFALAARAGID
jgi:hypothetical protein